MVSSLHNFPVRTGPTLVSCVTQDQYALCQKCRAYAFNATGSTVAMTHKYLNTGNAVKVTAVEWYLSKLLPALRVEAKRRCFAAMRVHLTAYLLTGLAVDGRDKQWSNQMESGLRRDALQLIVTQLAILEYAPIPYNGSKPHPTPEI